MPEVRDEDSQADYLTSPDETPYIVVSPGQDMHSLTDNVWRHHARDGWLDHIKGSVEESPDELPTHKECAVRRYTLQRLLLPMLSRPILQQSLTSQWRSVVMPCWQ
ncbi:Uncharacterised protein [Salmonella enterica subsp. enterica serovar Typhi]|nr:Uncharacterised protein [Salmonella enterica subsp. enterica serovar Typhi]